MAVDTEIGGNAREFPSTRWTLVLSSRDGTEKKRRALDELLSTYWKPLYFFVRRKGKNAEAAKDAIQGLFVHLLERDFLSKLDPARGRLRAYLKTAVTHYLINLHESDSAQKRGGGAKASTLDFDVAERGMTDAPETPEAACDREWATGVMERTMGRLRCEFDDGTRGGPFRLVETFFQFAEPPSYADASKEYGMSVPQLKAFLHRARARFRELLRQEVAETVSDPAEIDAEIEDLFRALKS